MTDAVKLEPCPFCNGAAEHVDRQGLAFYVCCTSCGATTDKERCHADAIDKWNRRAGLEAVRREGMEGLIARTLFASRAVAFSPQPLWDHEPNPLRGECWDDARDVVRALAANPQEGAAEVEGQDGVQPPKTPADRGCR